MKARSIKGNSPEELKNALEEITADARLLAAGKAFGDARPNPPVGGEGGTAFKIQQIKIFFIIM